VSRLLQRRLPAGLDALPFYAAASEGGARADTALFEGNDGRTLVMAAAAVRACAGGGEVLLEALSANGRALLDLVAARYRLALGDRLQLRFDPPASLDPEQRLLAPAPLHALRSLLRAAAGQSADPFAVAVLGVSGFDQAGFGEQLAAQAPDPIGFPDYLYWVPDSLAVIEPGGAARLLCPAFGSDPRHGHDAERRLEALMALTSSVMPVPSPPLRDQAGNQITADLDDDAYKAVVLQAKEAIAAGEVYQIVPSRTFSAACPDPFGAYRRLREIEPTSYRFYLSGPGWTLLGASPETSVRLHREEGGTTVEIKPIAGTRPRGSTPDEDDRLEAEMRLDAKELAEHMMLVDLARNDVARISLPGTRRVAKLLTVERFARVMHLVSSVTGKLAIGLDAFDALAACLNVGTLTGAPKLRATQLLRELERTPRGPYGGAVGWINAAGAMDTAVVIRSALVADGSARVRAGAGVVHDSDPQAEADETRRKASALLGVLTP
jgi:anthranilate synthase component 1